MKKLIVRAVAFVGVAAAGPALAQSTTSQTTTGSVTIIRPITLTNPSALAFGRIVRPSAGTSTVSIDETTGARGLSGGGDAVLLGGSTVSRATYNVGGEGGQTFSISVDPTFNLTHSGAGTPISVTLNSTATSGSLSGLLGSEGSSSFGVGGSFAVSSTTATGSYTGSFNVMVQYN